MGCRGILSPGIAILRLAKIHSNPFELDSSFKIYLDPHSPLWCLCLEDTSSLARTINPNFTIPCVSGIWARIPWGTILRRVLSSALWLVLWYLSTPLLRSDYPTRRSPQDKRFEVTINSDISSVDLNLRNTFEVPIRIEDDHHPCFEATRICQDKNVAVFIDGTGFLGGRVSDIYDQLPSFEIPLCHPCLESPAHATLCPVAGRLVFYEAEELPVRAIVILDFWSSAVVVLPYNTII